MSLYYVCCTLFVSEFKFTIKKLEAKETTRSFVTTRKRIDKNKLLKIDHILTVKHDTISFFTYCLESDIESAKKLVYDEVMRHYNKIKTEFEKIQKVVEFYSNIDVIPVTEELYLKKIKK